MYIAFIADVSYSFDINKGDKMIRECRVTEELLAHFCGQLAGMCAGGNVLSVSVKEWKSTRSLAANRKMWACLNDISKQVKWQINGVVGLISADDWKDILSASLRKEGRIAQGIDGGFVMLGQRTSKMKVQEMRDLIEVIYAFGASHDVKWSESIPPEYEEFARMNND